MVETARVQYVFLDVVGYTNNRSVEAQSEVVAILNHMVKATLNNIVTKTLQEMGMDAPPDQTILIPTGDGIAIALIDTVGFDVHLRVALEILRLIAEHNSITSDVMRRFEIRIGINENIDNVLLDINGKRNVAGAGISMAQRIMDKADASQILVGFTVYDVLRQREKYFSSFRVYSATGKHGVKFNVYQFLSKDAPGLSITVPSAFAAKKIEPVRLTKFVAYYMAYAEKNRAFLTSRKNDSSREYPATVLLCFLAEDSKTASETPFHEKADTATWGAGVESFEKQYIHYNEIEFWVIAKLAGFLSGEHLGTYSEHFVEGDFGMTNYLFVKPSGIQKLCNEWPEIAKEFGLVPKSK